MSAFNSDDASNNEISFFFVAAAALMERLPLAVSYVMATVTMVAHASWTLRQMYLCVCEYCITLWAFCGMTLYVHGIPPLMFSFSWGNTFYLAGGDTFYMNVSWTSLIENRPSVAHVLLTVLPLQLLVIS